MILKPKQDEQFFYLVAIVWRLDYLSTKKFQQESVFYGLGAGNTNTSNKLAIEKICQVNKWSLIY